MKIDLLKNLFYSMLRLRRIEEELANRYIEQEMRCPMHLCIGGEAIAVAISKNLKLIDRVFSNHRAHGHYLAKGGNLNQLIAELYGRKNGCSNGMGGSMHLIDLSVGFMGSTPIVGGTIPLSVGSAWSSSLKKDLIVTVVYFGDGCFEEGVMHESLNFASLHKLPIIFICENNNFSVYTPLKKRQPQRSIYKVAEAHAIKAYQCDGNDIEKISALSKKAIEDARKGKGPQFLEFSVYRWREHCGPNFDNELDYRSKEEVMEGEGNCPIEKLKLKILEKDSNFNQEIELYEKAIKEEIFNAFNFAISGDIPSSSNFESKIYA
jgi:pyruvate dehydrogenase E1 component alpha subunit